MSAPAPAALGDARARTAGDGDDAGLTAFDAPGGAGGGAAALAAAEEADDGAEDYDLAMARREQQRQRSTIANVRLWPG